MSFDTLAPHYRWMEFITAGEKLQRCRTRFISRTGQIRQALILGEGNGRFLAALRRHAPGSSVTCVDASERMLARAKGRLERAGLNGSGLVFVHADALEWMPPERAFDLIVTHFFLDCFTAKQLETIVSKLAGAALPGAKWLLADFRIPASGLTRMRAWLMHRAMYLFFRWAARLPARELTPPDPFLKTHGFVLQDRRISEWGLLHTDLWELLPQGLVG